MGTDTGAPQVKGEFETHLTVRARPGGDADEPLRRWAARHGMKFTRIVLDRGHHPDQPMLTYQGNGILARQRTAAREWTARLRDAGFEVARVKIEAAPWNKGVPHDRTAAAEPPYAACHFEHHVKLALTDTTAELPLLRDLATRHDAHVSRNARRALDADCHERFVTQRCHGVGRTEAGHSLAALLTALTDAGFPVVEVEEEYVVYDDNPAVDAGWLDTLAGASR
ncbi:hypothetical protein [Streptomyces sp. NPDC001978]|uniref:hypothetical protein n=1 Tax=Streptomyces sp. NPDC001978 TaxID=3364627 RepID=UPI0036B790D3